KPERPTTTSSCPRTWPIRPTGRGRRRVRRASPTAPESDVTGVSGTHQPRRQTSCPDAWLAGRYATMRLSEDVEAVRVAVRGGVAQKAKDFLPTGAGEHGRWYAVGDMIMTRTAYTDSRTLPTSFARIDWWVIKAGSIVNVGQGHPLFGQSGGVQVEF